MEKMEKLFVFSDFVKLKIRGSLWSKSKSRFKCLKCGRHLTSERRGEGEGVEADGARAAAAGEIVRYPQR